ncbi:hypothetical protein GHT06_001529 [Daphnia sinensis]|uniref:Protein kinase domain-containing protein n=1 Tax=Daphnia sinensis TaxID=1820382 RepID=A0AAD5KEH5_9CRUS|nr:hypothetical protein GHT06_001529 [Daphnia sinensis]
MKLVIRSGINVNAKDYNGLNALHYLCRYNSTSNLLDAVQTLLQSGIDANAKTNDGSNALHYLSRYNSKSNFKNLVGNFTELGLDTMAKNNDGWNVFYYLLPEEKSDIWFDRKFLLGIGSYGSVFKGKYAGREVAVKRVQIHLVNKLEEEAMKKLSHPNVVKLFHCESDADFRMYALELCDASLDQLFPKSDDTKKYNGPMPRHFEVLVQLASGLEHIHSKELIHRDIRPNNVLISKTTTSPSVEVTIKLADFGLSKQVNERGTFTLSEVRGNRQWLAPEILRRILQADNDERGNVKSDVFALALVFGYYFLKGEHLYGSSEKEIQDNIKGKKTINMEKIDGELREIYENDLFLKMLEDEPSKRMTSKEVVLQLLESIKDKLAAKEQELRHLCAAPDSQSDLTENIKKMIRLGIDLNAKDKNGFNALHLLCQYNSSEHLVDAIKVLIELGIDKNAKNKDGFNALHFVSIQFKRTPSRCN